MEAQSEVRNTSTLLVGLEEHLKQMEHVLLTLIDKTSFVGNASTSGITMMNNAFVNGQYPYEGSQTSLHY